MKNIDYLLESTSEFPPSFFQLPYSYLGPKSVPCFGENEPVLDITQNQDQWEYMHCCVWYVLICVYLWYEVICSFL